MITAHLKKLRQRTDISPEEEEAIRGLISETRSVAAGQVLIPEGKDLNHSVMLLEGWMGRLKDLEGGGRQITELQLAGDFVDLHGFTLKRLDHDIVALSNCQVGLVPHERLRAMTEHLPRLTRIYWLFTNIDAAITRELALSLGQRSAISRMAHIFCELYVRLEIIGRTEDGSYEFPLTQRELSECLGLTVVHANRTLQELRRRGLIELENKRLIIRDRSGLEGVAEFNPRYLYLDKHEL